MGVGGALEVGGGGVPRTKIGQISKFGKLRRSDTTLCDFLFEKNRYDQYRDKLQVYFEHPVKNITQSL